MSRIFMPTILAAASILSSMAYADSTVLDANSAALPLIVVTASKTPQAIDQVPARISVIDEKVIQQSPIMI